MSRLVRRVKETVVRALELQVDPGALSDDEVLFGGGLGVSSIAVMEVIVALEEEFGFEVGDEELRMERFESVHSIVGYVSGKIEGVGPPQDALAEQAVLPLPDLDQTG